MLPKADREPRRAQAVKLEPVRFQQQRAVHHPAAWRPGVHQGWVRLVGQDGLALDDVRYFAVEVQPAWPVLVVAPPSVSTRYLIEALAPLELRESGRARFKCDAIEQSRLADAGTGRLPGGGPARS